MRISKLSPESMEDRNRGIIDRALSARGLGRMPAVRRKAHNPTYPGVTDTITQPIYDSVSFAAAAAMAKTVLFQQPIGQGGKTLAQTNMTSAGQLQFPNSQVITRIRVYVSNNTVQADLQNLLANVSFTLTIGTKPWFQGPLVFLPAGMGGILTALAQIGTVAAGDRPYFSSSNGVADDRAALPLTQPITIGAGEGFNVTINPETGFNFAAAAGTTYGTGATILVALDGELTRSVS